LASTSGFTRRLTAAVRPRLKATADSVCNSLSLSTLKHLTPASNASAISMRVLPTPEKTTLAGSPPAAITRANSPPETMSKPKPMSAKVLITARLELAFIA
jgi:hypothetical protein